MGEAGKERAAVVAWLRGLEEDVPKSMPTSSSFAKGVVRGAADAIENGYHLSTNTDGDE